MRSSSARRRMWILSAGMVSLALGVLAAQAGWWLPVLLLVTGWLRWSVLIGRLHLVQIPRALARIALDERWRLADWEAEAALERDLLRTAAGGELTLRRARRRVARSDGDLGRRVVALERLDGALRTLTAAPRSSGGLALLLRTALPASWAMSTGSSAILLLSEATPGPVMAQPWRVLAGVATAAATGTVLGQSSRR